MHCWSSSHGKIATVVIECYFKFDVVLGIIPFGGSVNVASEASRFSELFPEMNNRILVAASSCFLFQGFVNFSLVMEHLTALVLILKIGFERALPFLFFQEAPEKVYMPTRIAIGWT